VRGRSGIFHKRRRSFHNNFSSIIQLGEVGKPNFSALGLSAEKKALAYVLKRNRPVRRHAPQRSARALDLV
jgi:hypothetical protein